MGWHVNDLGRIGRKRLDRLIHEPYGTAHLITRQRSASCRVSSASRVLHMPFPSSRFSLVAATPPGLAPSREYTLSRAPM